MEDFGYTVATVVQSSAALAQGVYGLLADVVRRRFNYDFRSVVLELLEVMRNLDPNGQFGDRAKLYSEIFKLIYKL